MIATHESSTTRPAAFAGLPADPWTRLLAPRRTSRLRAASQGGYSLLEVLIAVVITSTVVLALASGLSFVVRTGDRTDVRQRAQVVLTNVVEQVRAVDYIGCGDAAGYLAAHDAAYGAALPAEAIVRVDSVEYWHSAPRDGAGELLSGGGSFEGTCPVGLRDDGSLGEVDDGAQRITIAVEYPDTRPVEDRVTVTAEVVKVLR